MDCMTLNNHDIGISMMTEFRLSLYNRVYNNNELLMQLIQCLSESLSIINYELDMESKTIKLKIRKSVYKKKPNFNNDVLYFYPIINEAFRHFINNIRYILDPDGSGKAYIDGILNGNTSLLYNASCISDNIIIINL